MFKTRFLPTVTAGGILEMLSRDTQISLGRSMQGDRAWLHSFVNFAETRSISRQSSFGQLHCSLLRYTRHWRNHLKFSAVLTSRRPWRREMNGLWRRKLRLGLTAGEQETRGQSSDTGVARHDGITTGRCAAVVPLNSGLNKRPARPARPQRLHLCRHPSNSSAVNHRHHRERRTTAQEHPEIGRDRGSQHPHAAAQDRLHRDRRSLYYLLLALFGTCHYCRISWRMQ